MRSWKRAVPVVIFLLLAATLSLVAADAEPEVYYYGVELDGVLCGYAKLTATPDKIEGKDRIVLEHELFLMVSALGAEFNSEIDLTYHIDPATGQFTYHDSEVLQGEIEMDSKLFVEGNTVRYTSNLSPEEKVTEISPEVILANTLYQTFLKRDFVDADNTEKTYDIYEVREAEIQKTTYTRAGEEKLDLAGREWDTIILDQMNLSTGTKIRSWVEKDTGILVKVETGNKRKGYIADASVVKKIQAANLDETISTRTNESIPDLQSIRSMKVKAVLEPTGLWVTPESLNVAGQKFTGTVTDNRIEGVFEIEHPVFDGSGAPSFPHDYGEVKSLKEYLEAGELIQSDDPVLIEKAKEITKGASDSWEAAVLLSRWVAENIEYAIPGGGNARNTYDTRSGECGAHSFLLATFCRAVGIPARVVWGCMYIPNFGGAFGQHAWSEIYMGDAGWIPVDATANEYDYVDSGHIRVGEYQSVATGLNAVSAEILEYRTGDGEADSNEIQAAAEKKYADYLGEYTLAAAGMTVTTKVKDGMLVIDIPNKVVLGLNDPDDQGRWYAKLSDQLYAEFPRDDSGAVTSLLLHEMIRMARVSEPETVPDETPEEYRKHVGVFRMAQVGADFTVIWENGSLAVIDPLAGKTVHLQPPDDSGGWLDEFDKNTIRFEMGDDGAVNAMKVDSATPFQRK